MSFKKYKYYDNPKKPETNSVNGSSPLYVFSNTGEKEEGEKEEEEKEEESDQVKIARMEREQMTFLVSTNNVCASSYCHSRRTRHRLVYNLSDVDIK